MTSTASLLAACAAPPTPSPTVTPAPTQGASTLAPLHPTDTLPSTANPPPTSAIGLQSPASTPIPTNKHDTPTSEPIATRTATQQATARPPSATPTLNPILHVVIFIQENHTFDSLFAGFPGADGKFAGQNCLDALPADPPHQHADALRADGATTDAARCSYPSTAVPNYWQLAREFTLCDRFFSEVRGPSHPNYFMLTAAQTPIVNTPSTDECPDFCFDIPTLPNRLDARGLTWRDYGGILTDIKSLRGRREVLDRDDATFFRDAAAGTLPNVSWLNSGFLVDGDAKSGHPPASMCAGENYAVRVLNAIMNGPQWNSTAVFLLWDDWGGFYDHVPPPLVERWSDGTPLRYGFRVPCLVISPFARRGYVSHELHSSVSILHFVETLFELPPLTWRDTQASTMFDCFDFARAPHSPLSLAPRSC